MKVLVTGAAGFIGFHVSKMLCSRNDEVIGIDNLNDYYDQNLKIDRLNELKVFKNFSFIKGDISDTKFLLELFVSEKFDRVVHLAAQAGVRYSIENPFAYADSNLTGFINILESCRKNNIEHLVYASSSSVYGSNKQSPFSEKNNIDHPVSFYAATKKANEVMAHSYSYLYNLPTTGLRFFTVYGPWGRPDMSPILFADAITNGLPIKVFNFGRHQRDFTYIDDISEGVVRILDKVAEPNKDWNGLDPDPATSNAPWRIFNIGNNEPVELMHYIECLENSLERTAEKEMLPMQKGDMENTYADISSLESYINYSPSVSIQEGIDKFIDWYKDYYNKN